MNNSTEQIPSGATHKTPKGTYMKNVMGGWFEWLHEWIEVERYVDESKLTEISGDMMNLKKLTQAVFEGLPSEYRWAAVDRFGVCAAFTKMPVPAENGSGWRFDDGKMKTLWCSNERRLSYFMIERQDVPTADIDWNSAPQGTTHAIYEHDFVLWLQQQPSGSWLGQTALGDSWDKLSGEPEGGSEIVKRPYPELNWADAPSEATHAAKFQDRWGFVSKHDIIGWMVWGGEDWFAMKLAAGEEEKLIKRPESITDVARSIEAARIEEQKFKVKPCPHGCVAATIEQTCMPWPDGDPRYFETSEPYAGLPKTNMLADAVGKFHATASESTKEMIKKMIAGKLAACIQDEQAERTYPHYFKDVSDVDAIDLYHVARLYDITDPALFHAFKKIVCAGKRGAKDQAQDVQEAIDALKRWQELNV